MRGTSSHLRKTTTVFRIGATAYPNGRVVQESAFARFLGSFDFRLYQQNPPEAAIPKNVACVETSAKDRNSISPQCIVNDGANSVRRILNF
jgi:hypothetical protein